MVMLVGSTGLRRSEMFALRWSDIDLATMQVSVTRAVGAQLLRRVKTLASRKSVPLNACVCAVLADWRNESPYCSDDDFLFPSIRLNGKKPLTPDMVLTKIIRPALLAAGVTDKVIGWHSFRYSLASNLRSMGIDVKVAQELLRHANSHITLDIYTRAVSADKREVSEKQIEILMEKVAVPEPSYRSVPAALEASL